MREIARQISLQREKEKKRLVLQREKEKKRFVLQREKEKKRLVLQREKEIIIGKRYKLIIKGEIDEPGNNKRRN